MTRCLLGDLGTHVGETVSVAGWVMEDRDLGGIRFLLLRDRSGLGQLVLRKTVAAQVFGRQSAVQARGVVRRNAGAPTGVEVEAVTLDVLSPSEGNPPLDPSRSQPALDLALNHRMLSLRHAAIHRTFRAQAALVRGFRQALEARGFIEVHTPKIVASGTEGGANLFRLAYFDRPAYLAQSPQFYKEMLVGAGFERVFEVGPVFRAESHDTTRHLNEYTSLDLEIGFISDMEDLLALETDVLRAMLDEVRLGAGDIPLPPLPEVIPSISFREAEALLARKGKLLDGDLDPEAERMLSAHVEGKGNGGWVFVTRFPLASRPFYSLPASDPQLAESFDLVLGGLEVTTGGLRHHRYGALVASLRRRGLDPGDFGAYLEAHRWGMPPHGGLAIGLERITQRLLGLTNVREATFFPRDRHRLSP